MDPLLKYFPLVKIDEAAHMVWGIVTSETPDSDKEIADYEASKAAIKKWSDETLAKTSAAGQDPSLGNMRVMHQLTVGGKAIKIEYKDDSKQVWVGSEPANDEVWHLLKGGFLTSHSIGGAYAWTLPEGEYKRYGPIIGEISYVDRGANPDASFAYVKTDGSTELRKFAQPGPKEQELLRKLRDGKLSNLSEEDVNRIAKAVADSLRPIEKGVKYLAGEGHLPYTDESGKPDHRHMGAAWAALHGGYRGNKYSGPDKEKAIARLKEIYHSEGIEPPSEKAMLDEMRKQLEGWGLRDSELDTELAKFSALMGEVMGKLSAATGANMNPEQIKKCAAALGISEDEFTKLYAPAEELTKAKKGLAALHGHMEAAMEHHEKMHKAHGEMGTMHEKMAAHLGKCMKACKDVMGSDDKEAEKALHALVDELKKGVPAETPEAKAVREAAEETARKAAAAAGGLSKADVDKMIDEAVKKAVGELPAPDKEGIRVVPRASIEEIRKASESGIPDAIPV